MLILVTGATDGIGLETARQLARGGASVIVHGRRPERVTAACDAVRAAAPEARVEAVTFDLASLAAIRQGAAEIVDRFGRLDVLLNNAGVFEKTRRESADGFELTFAVNHLAPFLLTHLLRPVLGGGRVVTVSSVAHQRGRIDFDDLQMRRGFEGYRAYAASKLANILFTRALARRGVTANCLHPGVVGTKLLREGFGMGGNDTAAEGAATSVFLATSPTVAGVTGGYFVRCQETRPSAAALDEAAQERLWAESERLCGLAPTTGA